ncbi:MAG: DUF4180 domain-containing protein [Clostridiales bacterium]|nr:DUF4180 domain-containing protein [Clostridiales bacterium]
MLPSGSLSGESLRLSSCIAGAVLQKLAAYNIKTAAVLDSTVDTNSFREFQEDKGRSQTFAYLRRLAMPRTGCWEGGRYEIGI